VSIGRGRIVNNCVKIRRKSEGGGQLLIA